MRMEKSNNNAGKMPRPGVPERKEVNHKGKKGPVKMPSRSATGKVKARAGDGLANEGTTTDYNEER